MYPTLNTFMAKKEKFDEIANLPFMKGTSFLNDALDLQPLSPTQHVVAMREDRNDLETVREELHDILSGLKTSFYQQLELAAQAPHPRAYEVVAQTAEKRIHAANALSDLAETMNGPDTSNVKTINNTLMVSSSEMLDMMKNLEGKPDPIEDK